MFCPLCKKELEKAIFYGVEVDYCPKCLGLWFEEEELRWAKDERDKELSWIDIDLWKKETSFRISPGQKFCPSCRLPLYEVNYGDSKIYPTPISKQTKNTRKKFHGNGGGVKVDLCNICRGIWLDSGEFKKIIEYLRRKGHYEVLNNYAKNLIREFWEIFTGPETLREEIDDFLTILKILNYKLVTQYPIIAKIISNLPR